MKVKNLNEWLDKNSYRITEDRETEIYDGYDELTEEESDYEEDKTQGYLNNQDVLEASDSATYDNDLENFKKEFTTEDLDNYYTDTTEEEFKEMDKEEQDEAIEDIFRDNRTADDYYPIWLTAWEFPSGYMAETLNSFGVSGLVFFEVNNETFVSLTSCGMDMSPSLEFAYFMYSNVELDEKYFKERLFIQPSYFEYVVGKTDFIKFCEKLGITKRKVLLAENRVKKRLKDFSKSLDNLSELRDKGKINKSECGLLAMITYFKDQDNTKKEVEKIAK